MSTVIPLPDRPNLEQLRKRAREISHELQIPLNQAQLHMARGHGFASWPKLKKHVELVTRYTRTPDTAPSEDFLALACLTYGDDPPALVARAEAMLAANPALRQRDIWTAAATASVDAVRAQITRATEQGGPFQWEPLMYLCHSRIEASEAATIETATALLAAGANPDAGYLWHGFPSPFTALTGVFGAGENDLPPHAHAAALARLLLRAGADPNDSQVLYNRQFEPGTQHLDLLFEFGLGKGDGGPWKQRLTVAMDSPAEMLRQQLRWAIHHDMRDRVRLFAENGVDLLTPFDDERFPHCHGRTPAQWAALCGSVEMADEIDAAWQPLSNEDRDVGAVMRGVVAGVLAERPSLVVQAARTGRLDAVRAAVESGYDVNALGRSDSPCEMPWQTALHTAVERNDREMVELLLQLGADPSIKDARFDATPAGWAEHFGRPELSALLGYKPSPGDGL